MTRWSEDQYAAYYAKHMRQDDNKAYVADDGPERELQRRIEEYCEERAWVCIHDRSRRKNRPGIPDCIIAAPGRVYWFELKTKSGRLSPEQKQTQLRLMALGQTFEVVRSFKQFLRLVGGSKETD